jgi:hypothetical protein
MVMPASKGGKTAAAAAAAAADEFDTTSWFLY